MNEILAKVQEALKTNVWRPDFITEVDSDPRWRALDLIKEQKGVKLEWEWQFTDFAPINGEPIVVEFSTTGDDKVSQTEGLKRVSEIISDTGYELIQGNMLIVIMKAGK